MKKLSDKIETSIIKWLEKCILHLEQIKNWRCMKPFINLDILSSILKL